MVVYYVLKVLITPDNNFSLAVAAACLASAPSLRGVRVDFAAENRLHLLFGDWCLILALEEHLWVEAECRELAEDHSEHPNAADLACCKSRLSIWSEDSDLEMDHFNDWLLTVECLQERFTGLVVFDPVNGEWW